MKSPSLAPILAEAVVRKIRVAVLSFLMAAVVASALPAAAESTDAFERFRLGATSVYGAYVHFAPDVAYDAAVAEMNRVGLSVDAELPAADAVWVTGTARELQRAAAVAAVERLEPTTPFELAGETAPWATGARAVYEQTGGLDLRLPGPGGAAIDGSGVGIAIVDSGIDGTHEDLQWAGLDGQNPKVILNHVTVAVSAVRSEDGETVPANHVDAANTDTVGHGTHVAGIAAGTGAASGGRFRGVAPGAKLYGFNVMPAGTGVHSVPAALQWIYDHGHKLQPAIKVVNLSLGVIADGMPDSVEAKLADALVTDRGVTVVWAAMNGGGDGSISMTNAWGQTATPGVLMVANYDDRGAGSISGELSDTSSRGAMSDPLSWPDISAPGVDIVAPCAPLRRSCVPTVIYTGGFGYDITRYARLSGTSMAAPHVAGVAAMLYQAKPDITPAEVEYLLESTARKFRRGAAYQTDPAHPEGMSSYDKGHGLLDAYAAVSTLLGEPQGSFAGPLTQVAVDGEDDNLDGAADVVALTVTESAEAIRLTLGVRDLDDAAPTPVEYRLTAAVAGRRLDFTAELDAQGNPVVRGTHTLLAATRDGSEIHFDLSPALLGVRRGTAIVDARAEATLIPPAGWRMITVDSTAQGSTAHVFSAS